MTKEELSFHWDYFTNISKDFEATDRYVSHTSLGSINNDETFSLEFLKLLMIICAEFETMCKLINKHIDNTFNHKSKTDMPTLLYKIITYILRKFLLLFLYFYSVNFYYSNIDKKSAKDIFLRLFFAFIIYKEVSIC